MSSSPDQPNEGDVPEDSTTPAETGDSEAVEPRDRAALPRDLSSEQVDAAWAELVAGLESPTDAPRRGSGLSSRLIRRHDRSADSQPGDTASGTDADPSTPGSDESRPVPAGGPRDYAVADDDTIEELLDEGFSPPEPPPLPRPRDTVDRLAWGGAIGGPVLLVASNVFGWATWLGGVGVAAFIGGFVLLVTRMRNERDHDDPGAVV